MEDRLRECPRCNSYYVRIVHIQLNNTFKPECDNCQIEGPCFHSEQSAINWWNTRTDPLLEKMAEALEDALRVCDWGEPQPKPVAKRIEKALQEYREAT